MRLDKDSSMNYHVEDQNALGSVQYSVLRDNRAS